MTPRLPRNRTATAVAVATAVLLTGCSKKKDVDALDKELVGNAAGDQTDPALTSALEDQIMVDPALAQQKNGAAARPGTTPGQSPIPCTAPGVASPGGQTIGELAQAQAAGKAATNAACYRNLQYSAAWAQRLPAELPLFTDAQVSEAAGNATAPCNVRVVSFVSGAAIDRLVGFYEASGKRAGFAVERQGAGAERVVAGDKGSDAFYATFRSRQGGGTEVDLLANHGR